MIFVRRNIRDLVGLIIVVTTDACRDEWPRSNVMTFDEGFESIRQSIQHLRGKLGDALARQLLEMTEQAKAHFEDGEIRFGGRLMQDIEYVAQGKKPFAFPEEMYRWPL